MTQVDGHQNAMAER